MTYIITHRWNRSVTPASVPAPTQDRVPITEDQLAFLMTQLATKEGRITAKGTPKPDWKPKPAPAPKPPRIGRRPIPMVEKLPQDRWFTNARAAELFGVNPNTMRERLNRAVQRGELERMEGRTKQEPFKYRRVSQ